MTPDTDQPAWAIRLEQKLEAILEALTSEDIGDEDEPGIDLDGNRLPRERDQSQPL
jgi:hypothetical protein